MKFTNKFEVDDFMKTANECEGAVWLESRKGDKLDLKSVFSSYIAMASLLLEKSDELELFCQLSEDRAKFYKYFNDHPDILKGE